MYQKKCVHQAVTGLGKYVPQGLPTHVETVVLLSHKKPVVLCQDLAQVKMRNLSSS